MGLEKRKSERVEWFNKELKKLRGEVDDDIRNTVLLRNKAHKLLNIVCSEVEYNSTDVFLFKYDYLGIKRDIELFIKQMLEKECLRRLFEEGASKAEYSRSYGYVHEGD